MNSLFDYPEVQTGLVPFAIALLVALLARKHFEKWAVVGVVPAFVVSAFLINGFNILPLTGARKIILIAVIALLLSIAIEIYRMKPPGRTVVNYMVAFSSALWVSWPILLRNESAFSWLISVGGIVYVLFLVYSFERIKEAGLRPATGLLALGMGTGACAIMAASALYGQLALSASNALAAVLILSVFTNVNTATALLIYPLSLLMGLLAMATMIFAELPWYALLLLATVPAVLQLDVARNKSGLRAALLLLCISMLPVMLAVLSVWLGSDETSSY